MRLTRLHDKWDQLNELFQQAMGLAQEELATFCQESCGGDEELRDFLYELVTSAQIGDDDLRGSLSQIAQDIAAEESLTGKRVGAYQFDELLGRGGMGEVYLASRADGEFEKKVAIKIVRGRLATDEFARHFHTELQVLANLDHPSIPALVDAGQFEDGRPYFVCDFVDGVKIDIYCEQHALSTAGRLDLLRSVGEALQHAHNNLILHLDIKPDNILVQPDGTPSLLDFGVARLMSERDDGHRAFSPGYASPEQIRGDQPSAASDLYSLGALMYHLLVGEPPFSAPRFAPSETVMAERAQFTERLDEPALLRGVNADLRAIVRKAMANAPDERYASVESFLRDLKHYRHDLPVSARTQTFAYRLGKYIRRHEAVIGVVSVVFVVLVAFGVREADLRRRTQAASAATLEASLAAKKASAVAEREAETARQVSTFLVDLFEVSDSGETRGNSVTARELLDKGAERISDDLADQPAVAARLLSTIGTVYIKLGLYEQATLLLEKALSLRERVTSNDDPELARALNELGIAYRQMSRFEEAEAVLKRALDIREKTLGPDDADVAQSLRALGTLYMRQGRFDDAEKLHLRGIAIHEKVLGADHPEYAEHLGALARAYSAKGRYEEAEKLYLQAIGILEKARGPDDPGLANILHNLANVYGRTRRFEEAEHLLKRSFALQEKILESDHPRLASTLMNLGTVLLIQERLDEAEQYYLRALKILRKTLEPDDYRLALSHLNLGVIYEKRGLLDAAEREGLAAMRSWTKKLEPDHPFLGGANWLLANVYHGQGFDRKAEPLYAQALAIFGKRPADDSDRIDMTEDYAAFLRATGREAQAKALEAGLRK